VSLGVHEGALTSTVFVGDESLLIECATTARAAGADVVAISTRSAVARERAEAEGFIVLSSEELQIFLADRHVDVLFSIANEYVVSDDILTKVGMAVNFHDGPLPDYRGLAVTTWALFRGESQHAVTWHTMTSEVDAGEIVLAETFDLSPDETAFSLNARCYETALRTFPDVLRAVMSRRPMLTAQPDRPGEWFGRYQRPVAVLDPAKPAAEIDRAVRSLALGPRIRNRLGAVRWIVGDQALVITATELVPVSGRPAGAVALTARGVQLATSDGDVLITELTTLEGVDLQPASLEALTGHAQPLDDALLARLTSNDEHLARHETFWLHRLAQFNDAQPTHLHLDPEHAWARTTVPAPVGANPGDVAAAVFAWWSRTSNSETVWFEFSNDEIDAVVHSLAPLTARPLGRFTLHTAESGADDTLHSASAAVAEELQTLTRRGPYLRDLIGRSPATRHRSVAPSMQLRIGIVDSDEPEGSHLFAATIDPLDSTLTLAARTSTEAELQRAAEQISALMHAAYHAPDASLHSLDLLGSSERALLDSWNDTGLPYDRTATVDRQFREQALRTPDAPAASCADATVTYAQLLDAVDRFAARLEHAGATRGSLVGVALERNIDLLVALLGILSVGSAYVPLDPGYPEERLAYMVSDSDLQILVATPDVATRIAGPDLTVLSPSLSDPSVQGPATSRHTSDDVAYVIYTSGSTGRPKGVMLQHGNVVNFFAAMDAVIDHDPPGIWLAVTSLSFDISVLELLWTVTRGFEVVIQQFGITSPGTAPAKIERTANSNRRPTNLSLFFFAAGDAVASDGYRLLRESSQYADQHGFEAVWLPERHFHEFGGAYPNPSVLASAVAVLTSQIHIRAGSVVLPLHPSARVAEEWSVVDNLSQGRVGISFAPGWQPNDFVLNPSGYRTARDDLQSRIDEVRALWRGDHVEMVGHDEAMVSVRTLPRPVQTELPVWLTSAGTTKTFEKAGEMGLNLLTHMLGQSAEQLADNIQVYRTAWRAAGHAGEGRITVMLHTFLCDDSATARQKAEQPMKRYLGTATGLLKNMASAFPTFASAGASADEAFRSLSDSEMDELLTMAAARYLDTSGLFGSTDDALEMAESLSEMGVDELACLIDFGIDTQDVLDSMPLLGALKARLDTSAAATDSATHSTTAQRVDADVERSDQSVAGLVSRHSITHLQCTPSLAAMLMAEPGDRAALGAIKHLMVGGEALPEKLGAELREAVSGRFTNMYGPTETTIWSLVHEIEHAPVGPVPIGRPIANTTLHILDPSGRPVPVHALGELHIGGDGVARGYLGRDDLTQQRFADRDHHGRLYATGDLARFGNDGIVEFAGRVDFQVKIRGHRIELGEIEAQLDSHGSVERSVVVARGDASDARLIAFVVPAHGAEIDEPLLRKHVASTLPDVMVPDFVVAIAALPLTLNGKIDRAALPTDVSRSGTAAPLSEVAAPKDDIERLVADVWTEQLGRPVGRSDNFFDIGGHSLLAVAVFRTLQQTTGLRIALTDVFRYPTVAGFAAYLQQLRPRAEGANGAGNNGAIQAADVGSDRGAKRRAMLERRRGADPSVKDPAT